MTEEILVPITIFGAMSFVAYVAFHYSYKKRMVVYEAIKVAIEKTGNADPQLVEAIVRDNVGRNADLRKGIILIAVAAGFLAFGFSLPAEEAINIMFGIAAFPGLVGLAYVGFHFFAPREPTI